MKIGKAQRETKSPLKERPLRLPGQSLDDLISDRKLDLFGEFVLALVTVCFAGYEWLRYSFRDQFHPWLWSAIALSAITWAGFRFRKEFAFICRIRRGRDGERVVAENLGGLARLGYRVLHDVVGGNFNVDHVLIGPTGIYAIETKTYSKRGGQDEVIEFDGEQILLRGKPLLRNPLDQARINSRWLRDILHAATGKSFDVTPTVIFPGWFVQSKHWMREVLVLNAHDNSFKTILENRPVTLVDSDIELVSYHLQRFIRTQDPEFIYDKLLRR